MNRLDRRFFFVLSFSNTLLFLSFSHFSDAYLEARCTEPYGFSLVANAWVIFLALDLMHSMATSVCNRYLMTPLASALDLYPDNS